MSGVELRRHTTIGLGGPARAWIEPDSSDAVIDAVCTEDPLLILGGGSNLVVADAGFDGTVVKLGARFANVEVQSTADHIQVIAEAGASFDALVARAVDEGFRGLEVLSGIPGSIGATPMQNVGAYGREIAELIEWVEVLDRDTREVQRLHQAECGFAYRHSRFRGHSRWIILRVALSLTPSARSLPIRYAELARALGIQPGESAPLARVRETVMELRASKGMLVDANDPDSRSCGSFFTNPIVDAAQADEVERRVHAAQPMPRFAADAGKIKLAAAWLVERAGYTKGYGDGAVGLSRKHTLALVNRGSATTGELLAFARTVRDGVRDKLGVTLEPEPIFVGCSL